MQKKLDRTLGLYSAITISTGTMIGSAIFVLAGTSFETAGPAASLAVFLAGIAALFTAFSFAELVTFIPTAGGGYAYARDATDNGILGFMAGWGFWLGYAMSCGLFALGFGNFLNYFFPFIPQMIGAYALIFYVMITNIKGVENSGKLQNIITTALLILLTLYSIYGAFFVDVSKQRPFFPEGLGLSGTFTAMGFLYITYIGYGLITTASEEVINPEKTIPKAIMISLALVTVIKTAVFFIGSSIISWDNLVPAVTDTPLINTAIVIAGRMGGYLFAMAGIFATVSSINTAMMAASRTSFAIARDNHLPRIFRNIHPKTKTPIASILAATLIVVISTAIRDLEHISTVTSIFSLLGYSLVNLALIIFRKKRPDAKRHFKVPFYPITPILGIAVNIFLVFQLLLSDFLAMSVAVAILIIGVVYYYLLLPKLKDAHKVITTEPIPKLQFKDNIEMDKAYKILIPIASPYSFEPLVDIGAKIGGPINSKILPVHIMDVPEVIPLDSRYNDLREGVEQTENIFKNVKEIAAKNKNVVEPLLVMSRNVNKSIKNCADESNANFVLLGWHSSGLAYRMLGGITHRALEELPYNVGIFKNGNNDEINKILYPYGGGFHSQEAAQIVKRIAESTAAKMTFLRVIDEEITDQEKEKIKDVMLKSVNTLGIDGEIKIVNKEHSIVSTIVKEANRYDLIIMGATAEWGVKEHITGSTTDKIMEKIDCSGLIIRRYNPLLRKKKVRGVFAKFKKHVLE
ncbi:amino acid permease [Natronospora cellulosivora (SeqCode)]